jgi:hypothetical protein
VDVFIKYIINLGSKKLKQPFNKHKSKMQPISYKDLQVGKKYLVATTSISEERTEIKITSITSFPNSEAMIILIEGGGGYGAGGANEGPGGPRNVFWAVPDPKPPPPLDLSGVQMSSDDWAMTYGLRRCRLCGYNEGPEICPSDCYGVNKVVDKDQ